MNQNISAHLDLTKSLRVFEETVPELLSFTELEKWDGRTIKHKEEKIREAALIGSIPFLQVKGEWRFYIRESPSRI